MRVYLPPEARIIERIVSANRFQPVPIHDFQATILNQVGP